MILGHDVEFKFLPTTKLIELLSTLSPDTFIWPNKVGNLTIFTREGQGICVLGFVDLLHDGEIEMFD